MGRIKKLGNAVAFMLLFVLAPVAPASAVCPAGQQSCSSSYSVGEAFFGNGGELNPCSASYCTKQALGETGVGNTASASYQAQAGFNSNRNEYIEFLVNTASINFGTLTSSSTSTGTATFSVKAYLANGYQVVSSSPAPKNGSYTMQTPGSPTASSVGTEQFGMNLVKNQSCGGGLPALLGADPAQVPGPTYSYGSAATGYNSACNFKYAQNDVIAQSAKSSGETDYTISYIMNISNVTPGGTYSMAQSLVATATF